MDDQHLGIRILSTSGPVHGAHVMIERAEGEKQVRAPFDARSNAFRIDFGNSSEVKVTVTAKGFHALTRFIGASDGTSDSTTVLDLRRDDELFFYANGRSIPYRPDRRMICLAAASRQPAERAELMKLLDELGLVIDERVESEARAAGNGAGSDRPLLFEQGVLFVRRADGRPFEPLHDSAIQRLRRTLGFVGHVVHIGLGDVLAYDNALQVDFVPGTSGGEIQRVAAAHGLTLSGPGGPTPYSYVARAPADTGDGISDIADALLATGLVARVSSNILGIAHPASAE